MTLGYGAARTLCEARGVSDGQCEIAEDFGAKLAQKHEAMQRAAMPPVAQA